MKRFVIRCVIVWEDETADLALANLKSDLLNELAPSPDFGGAVSFTPLDDVHEELVGTQLSVGMPVIFKRDVDRFPHFRVLKGSTGIVTRLDQDMVCVRVDVPLENCEEWDNEVQWFDERFDETVLMKDIAPFVVEASPTPVLFVAPDLNMEED